MNLNKLILFVALLLIVNQSTAMEINPLATNTNPLMSLLHDGKIEELKKQVENGANVNEYKDDRSNILWATISRLDIIGEATVIELVNLFIKKGADVNYTWGGGLRHTILHTISINTILPLIDSVITAGMDINIKSKLEYTPLNSALFHWSFMNSNSDLFYGYLTESAQNKCLLTAEKLIARGADVNAKSNHGDTPLHNAVYDKNMVALLLFHSADHTSKDKQERTPYDCTDNIEIKKMLENNESVRNVVMSQVHEKVFGGNNAMLALRTREYGMRRILLKNA
jgi:ankyrin repeat protein